MREMKQEEQWAVDAKLIIFIDGVMCWLPRMDNVVNIDGINFAVGCCDMGTASVSRSIVLVK